MDIGKVVGFGSFAAFVLSTSARRARRISTIRAAPVAKVEGKSVAYGYVEGENRGENPMKPPKMTFDPYYWMRDDDRKREDVIEHLRKENEYTEMHMSHLKQFTKDLYDELLSHVKETDNSVPYPYGPYLYYSRTVKGSSYRIYCRKPLGSEEEQVILDMNELAKSKKHLDLGGYSPSPDHSILAYSLDENGYETYEAHFKDLRTGNPIKESLPELTGRLVWGKDNETIFYAVHDAAHRPYRLYRHRMGTDPSTDEMLFEESDDRFWMGFGKTLSGRYLICSSGTSETSEVHLLDLEDPNGKLNLVHPRTEKLRYSVDHREDRLYIVTNADGAKNEKIMCTSCDKPGKEHWKDLIPYDQAINIEDITCFKNAIVVDGRKGGFTSLWVIDPATNKMTEIGGFPDPISVCGTGINKVYDTDVVRIMYESMVTPSTTFDYNMKTKDMKMIHQKEVPKYDKKLYTCERLEAVGHDGTKIPMSMVYKKGCGFGMPKSARKPGPVLLNGYGSYGICNDPDFVASYIPLLDHGVCVVVAHIRGGGEMGRHWYEDEGKFLTKKNTFLDFISCAKHLTEERYTDNQHLCITGRSAGGLLMGATLNMAPELFKCCVAGVPFVDVLTTMSDATIPLTCGEWDEWGNPNEEKYHEYMKSYCPYTNVTMQDYPAILITAGLFDPRVAYWEPMKWCARLRERKTDNNVLLLKTDLDSGHFSASDRYKYLREKAFEYAFILDQLGRGPK